MQYRKIDADDRKATFAVEKDENRAAGGVWRRRGAAVSVVCCRERFCFGAAVFGVAGGNITALDMRKLSGVSGAMLARQSRITGTVVDVLMKEFLITDAAEAAEASVDVGSLKLKKLDEIIERILIQYGDDSVQELECATVLFNSVSNLATKIIEDRRLGGFIEQSSRYVYYTGATP